MAIKDALRNDLWLRRMLNDIKQGNGMMTTHTGDTAANWQSGTATSGLAGADIVNMTVTTPKLNSGLIIDVDSFGVGITFTVRLYQKVNGVERQIYSQVFTTGNDPAGLPIINGQLAVNDYIRAELYTATSSMNGRAVGWEWFEK